MQVLLGWIVICVAMYVVAAAMVYAASAAIRAIRPDLRSPKALLPILSAGAAVALWYCIPLVVHALYGGAAH